MKKSAPYGVRIHGALSHFSQRARFLLTSLYLSRPIVRSRISLNAVRGGSFAHRGCRHVTAFSNCDAFSFCAQDEKSKTPARHPRAYPHEHETPVTLSRPGDFVFLAPLKYTLSLCHFFLLAFVRKIQKAQQCWAFQFRVLAHVCHLNYTKFSSQKILNNTRNRHNLNEQIATHRVCTAHELARLSADCR
jgi:hypothetical protein